MKKVNHTKKNFKYFIVHLEDGIVSVTMKKSIWGTNLSDIAERLEEARAFVEEEFLAQEDEVDSQIEKEKTDD